MNAKTRTTKTSRLLIVALAVTASLTLGFDACAIDEIPVGTESEAISLAWDYDPKNLKEHVQRLELVVQLMQRESDRVRAEYVQLLVSHEQTLADRAWFHDCMTVLMDPNVAPNTSQFNVYASMVDWCKVNFGD